MFFPPQNKTIAVIGLGYVGLPLSVEFGKHYKTIGYDLNVQRLDELRNHYDRTLEVDADRLKAATHLSFSGILEELRPCNIFLVTVPTPIDEFRQPDLKPLLKASEAIGSVLKKGDLVIYESTVYPGCTEEDCVPVLEKVSGLKFNHDFFCGYSPERVSPGDPNRRMTDILKVTSGSTPEVADYVDALYKEIIKAGTFKASSIKVAEASKAIENAQRDVNISFMNELSLIFDRLGIDTNEVIEAAATKWNFLPFKPGLVGGHCISVDPYYLLHKAESVGYYPQVILSGRRINDAMSGFIANKVVKLMIKKEHRIAGSRVLMLGVTYKENCPDIRNTKVMDVIKELTEFGVKVEAYDPWADTHEVHEEYGISLVEEPTGVYAGIILAVSHEQFFEMDWSKIKDEKTVVFDVKAILDPSLVDGRL